MTRLALPAILVIGAFSSAALAAPVSASPWSPTGTPTPLPEHSVASSQAHRVSSIDVHSRELTTRELAVSTSLEPKTRSNPNLIARDEGIPRIPWSDLTAGEKQALDESRLHRGVPKNAADLDLDDWQVLAKYMEAEVEATRTRVQEAEDQSKIQGADQSYWKPQIEVKKMEMGIRKTSLELAESMVDRLAKKDHSPNAVPKPAESLTSTKKS
ncbi:hypothetical protein EV361DRAFT_948398 [Lentinula raphanica]|uniref:Uncharacterized protein n=1 Tax=Lentinula raphanica TaxID=153919 RepID=A0AA38PES9_9AGAR|nr:hypothetical protein F5878DRAFT_609986 [Lentinula raphanica]KAJ3972903.1 hypothetical protein EV361DRAFT_948398 [Lentinula raphanica]